MIIPMGAGLLFVGGFAVLMMNVTHAIPRRLGWRRAHRKEDDPEGWRRYLIFYTAMAAVGTVLLLVGLVADR